MAVVSSCRVTLSAGAKALTEMVRQRCPVKLFGKSLIKNPKSTESQVTSETHAPCCYWPRVKHSWGTAGEKPEESWASYSLRRLALKVWSTAGPYALNPLGNTRPTMDGTMGCDTEKFGIRKRMSYAEGEANP